MADIIRKMNSEIQQELMGIAPVSQEYGVPFTPEFYLKKEMLKPYWPVFYQRSWTEDERQALQNLSDSDDAGDIGMELTRKTIKDVKNHWDIGSLKVERFEKDEEGYIKKELFDNWPYVLKIALLYNAQILSGMALNRNKLKPETEESLG